MYALSFDMTVADLTSSYPGKQYNNAYYEIKRELAKYGFEWIQGSTYLHKSTSEDGELADLFSAVYALKSIEWFRASVRDIRGFKVEDWSNFTNILRK